MYWVHNWASTNIKNSAVNSLWFTLFGWLQLLSWNHRQVRSDEFTAWNRKKIQCFSIFREIIDFVFWIWFDEFSVCIVWKKTICWIFREIIDVLYVQVSQCKQFHEKKTFQLLDKNYLKLKCFHEKNHVFTLNWMISTVLRWNET